MSYKLLSEPIRKYIRSQGWEALRPIQAASISKILSTDHNYILASRTASGKTEAAFLPILSKTNFNEKGVQVLYISPLIALINDQVRRVEDLCKNLEIDVTKWHGEANRTLKKNLIKNPNGIVLITPESIEAMFVNAPYNITNLFGNLKFVIIDEIHSFLGVDRGLQLMSLLFRIQRKANKKFRIIGLSATIGDENYIHAKKLTGDVENTKVLLDRTKKPTIAKFKFYESESKELPLELLKDLYIETKENKALVFPNSRARTEEVAVKLHKISDRINGHKNYFSHHSSVDKEIRESVEFFAKNNQRDNFCISATSTLELGIDIGTVDKIIQIDSTYSVASLVQRIGRSGRKEGEKSVVCIYATEKWSLLQSLACWNLYKKDFLEPINTAIKPYDLLLHQLLSIVKQYSGIQTKDLIHELSENPVFEHISTEDIETLLHYSIEEDFLERIRTELILGLAGEKIVNSRDFYSVFSTDPDFKVIHSGRKVGQIPFSPQIQVNENLLLAAKIWKIKDIDHKAGIIEVIPAKDGKAPSFFGGTGGIHEEVRKEMLRILKSKDDYKELNQECKNILNELRFEFKNFDIRNFEADRPLITKEHQIILYTFSGTKINRSVSFLLAVSGYDVILNDNNSSIEIRTDSFAKAISDIKKNYEALDSHLEEKLIENDTLLSFSKWGIYLPMNYKIEIVKERYFDFKTAIAFINNMKIIKY
ncbi:DEAD/DEAH box helicase [Christiangramia sp.]|uniref:DEAD/DEAH box helicase n=1 Tax=Christiangramia sp. TaxID=1931228 RepID=UPI0026155E47|nr:DEAD/DEAH box helicase [Christiangramia sp.]